MTSNANPAKFGQAVTFKATMGSSSGGGIPTGAVNFFDNGVLLGTGTINASGVATFTTSSLSVGSHPITATYGGDSNFTDSNSGSTPLTQTVQKSNTSATLTRSTPDANQPLTLTAAIAPIAPGGGSPTGSVTFLVDGVVRGTVNLSSGTAALFLPNGLSQGTHTVTVQYSGDGNYNACSKTITYSFGGRG